MWPFNKKKSVGDIAVDSLPRAITVASQKWLEFESQPFATTMALDEKLIRFSEGLGRGLRQWPEFKSSPDSLMLLIAAKGAERSRTHLRIEIETALRFPLPTPHERTDEEENRILMDRIIDRAARKWRYFHETIKFNDDTPLAKNIDIFQVPFVQGIKNDMPVFLDAPYDFFRPMLVLGITESGTLSPNEIAAAFDVAS